MNSLDFRDTILLIVLEGLYTRKISPIREYEFHQVILSLNGTDDFKFKYLTAPISYSYDLHSQLQRLERWCFMDEFMLVRNGWVPRYEYEISEIGRAEAQDQRVLLQQVNPQLLQSIEIKLNEFAANYSPPISINPH